MANIRLIYMTAAGIGYFCGFSLPKKPEKTFTVNATGSSTRKKSLLTKYGVPKRDVILNNADFQISYDNRNRLPNWVIEHLTLTKLKIDEVEDSNGRPIAQYVKEPDERIDRRFQSKLQDFRGRFTTPSRLAAKRNHKHSVDAFKDCYKLSNFAPQARVLKCTFWNDLECYAKFLTAGYEDIYVFTGPLFLCKDDEPRVHYALLGSNYLSVPTHFFKIIIGRSKQGGWAVGCFLIPNEDIDEAARFNQFRVSLDELEKKAGFKLFKKGNRPFTEHLLNISDFRVDKIMHMKSVGLAHVV